MIKSILRNIFRHHSSLCDITELVNRIYSPHVLQSTAVTFFDVVCALYYFNTVVLHPDFFNLSWSATFMIATGLLWIVTFSSKVVLLAVACSYTSHEVSG
jgi:hypothetical protein